MKSITEFLKNELVHLNTKQRRFINERLWSLYNDLVGITDEDAGTTEEDDDKTIGEAVEKSGELFAEGLHPRQKLIMQKLLDAIEAGEGEAASIESFNDFLVLDYRKVRELVIAFQGLSKELPGVTPQPEVDLDERIEQKKREILENFPKLFTEESFLTAVRIQDAEEKARIEYAKELRGIEPKRRS